MAIFLTFWQRDHDMHLKDTIKIHSQFKQERTNYFSITESLSKSQSMQTTHSNSYSAISEIELLSEHIIRTQKGASKISFLFSVGTLIRPVWVLISPNWKAEIKHLTIKNNCWYLYSQCKTQQKTFMFQPGLLFTLKLVFHMQLFFQWYTFFFNLALRHILHNRCSSSDYNICKLL